MRFRIPIKLIPENNLENNMTRITIPINYDAMLLHLIKAGLNEFDPKLFKRLYPENTNTEKIYSTSVYFPKAKFTKNTIILNKDAEIKLFLSVENMELGLKFYNIFMKMNLFKLSNEDSHKKKYKELFSVTVNGQNLIANFYEPQLINVKPITQNKVMFKTMSPLVLRDRNEDSEKIHFISCSTDNVVDLANYNRALRNNVFRKLLYVPEAKHPELELLVSGLTLIPIHMKKVVRKSYDIKIEATKGIFWLRGDPALLTFLESIGLGEYTGSFNGMISRV